MRLRTSTIFPFPFPFGNDETVEFWHNTSLGISRKNILKVIGLAISSNSPNEVLIHTERVTRSIFEWADREQTLLNDRNRQNNNYQHTCALLTTDHLLPSEAFGQVMRGILEGIDQASGLNAAAGCNAWAKITSKYTFLVSGVAKVSLLTENVKCTHPLLQFKIMIEALTSQHLPSELRWLLYFIYTRYSNKEFCDELHMHPSLYARSVRLDFRCKVSKRLDFLWMNDPTVHSAIESTFIALQWEIIKRRRVLNLPGHRSAFSWKTHIQGFSQNSPYRQALTPQPPAAAVTYHNYPLQFVRYGRNMAQHPGNLQEEDLESGLTDIWEDFIPCLHEALRIHKQLPKVYDQKDSIEETR